MTETQFRANMRARRFDEEINATEVLENVVTRLEREISESTKLRNIDLTEYAAMVTAYAKAERLLIDILKAGETE